MNGKIQALKPFGWAGLWLKIPSSFRLHHIEGDTQQGACTLADDHSPRLTLAWRRATRAKFDADRFVRGTLARAVGRRHRCEPTRFDHPVFDPLMGTGLTEEGEEHFAGFCPETRRAVRVTCHGGNTAEVGAWGSDTLIKSLIDQIPEKGQEWAFFSLRFRSPPRFEYDGAHLQVGDMSVQFSQPGRKRKPTLGLRFIYPAALALSRQDLEQWLREVLEKGKDPWDRPMGRVLFHGAPVVLHPCRTPLGRGFRADARPGRRFRLPLPGRRPVSRGSWILHDDGNDRLVIVSVSTSQETVEEIFEYVLEGMVHDGQTA